MIINPIIRRSTLSARGAHAAMVAAIVSVMDVPQDVRWRDHWYRVTAFAKSRHRNKICGVSQSSNGITPKLECWRGRKSRALGAAFVKCDRRRRSAPLDL